MADYDFSGVRLFVKEDLRAGQGFEIDPERANYLINVMRLKAGAKIYVFNGRDGEWAAEIAQPAKRRVALNVLNFSRAQTSGPDFDYCFAPLKQARLDYIAQKAVEMGAARLRPLMTRRTQVSRINLDRLRANAIEAAEQCGVLRLAEVSAYEDLDDWLSQRDSRRLLVFCDEDAACANPIEALSPWRNESAVDVLVGPEGGFEDSERERLLAQTKIVRLSLGPRILRADTAGVAVLALLGATIGDWREAAL